MHIYPHGFLSFFKATVFKEKENTEEKEGMVEETYPEGLLYCEATVFEREKEDVECPQVISRLASSLQSSQHLWVSLQCSV